MPLKCNQSLLPIPAPPLTVKIAQGGTLFRLMRIGPEPFINYVKIIRTQMELLLPKPNNK